MTPGVDAGHAALLLELERLAGGGPRPAGPAPVGDSSYTAGGRPYYGVSVPDRRRSVKGWLQANRALPAEAVLATADSLLGGPSYEEKTLGAMILKEHRAARSMVTPAMVDRWLDDLVGWGEVDSLCQSLFEADQLLDDWPGWRALVTDLSTSPNANKRRASLVLLTGPVRHSSDERLARLAFDTVDRLAPERAILITKAVSWLLRSLVPRHREAVIAYLQVAESLPANARRETRTLIETGTKSGRSGPGRRRS